jgi:hypothetical protein
MQLTDKQLAANRANAAKSTGPKTITGKRNSSRNALRHARLAKTILIDGENAEPFLQLLADLTADFQPSTTHEQNLVDTMAVARWRVQRRWVIEKEDLNHQQRQQADSTADAAPATRAMFAVRAIGDSHLEAQSRYEVRFDRQYNRAATELRRLRAEKYFLKKRSRQLEENKGLDQ